MGAAETAVEIAEAEAGVVGVARDAAGLGLALDDDHARDPESAELDRRREPGRTAADDHDVGALAIYSGALRRDGSTRAHARPSPATGTPRTSASVDPRASARNAATAAPQ